MKGTWGEETKNLAFKLFHHAIQIKISMLFHFS